MMEQQLRSASSMMIDDEIRQLASRSDTNHPFLTLYVDTNRNDAAHRDRIRLFLKHEAQRIREALEGHGENGSLEKGIRQIERFMENDLEPETRGVAIFACPREDFFRALQLPLPVQQELSISSRPHLRQLVELRDLHPTAALAMVDAKSARLFELEFGKILSEIDFSDPDMPRRHDQGGWSQANLQRHVQDHIDRHHKEVADVLTRFVDEGRVRDVVLSGQDRSLANFRAHLPKRVDEQVSGTLHLDIRSNVDDIIEACQGVLEAARAARQQTRIEELVELAKKNGRGALGIARVADAANQRKLGQLFVSRTSRARGWKCTHCAMIGHQVPLGCPACGRKVLTIDLIEELIAAAQLEGAAVEFVATESVLDRHEGVGAALRF